MPSGAGGAVREGWRIAAFFLPLADRKRCPFGGRPGDEDHSADRALAPVFHKCL